VPVQPSCSASQVRTASTSSNARPRRARRSRPIERRQVSLLPQENRSGATARYPALASQSAWFLRLAHSHRVVDDDHPRPRALAGRRGQVGGQFAPWGGDHHLGQRVSLCSTGESRARFTLSLRARCGRPGAGRLRPRMPPAGHQATHRRTDEQLSPGGDTRAGPGRSAAGRPR
jgi:hypothetical protein